MANSKPMRAEPKGSGFIHKYHFGEYGIISSKPNTIIKKGSQVLFTYNGSSEQKISFVFVGNKIDTISVYASVNTNFRRFETDVEDLSSSVKTSSKYSVPLSSNEHFVAYLSSLSDTSHWKLVSDFFIQAEAEGNSAFYGSLTDGSRIIEIRPIRQWSNGKPAYRNKIIGYEFVTNHISLAAIQESSDTSHPKYVWLKTNLSEDLRVILAASAATLMVMLDDQKARLDQ